MKLVVTVFEGWLVRELQIAISHLRVNMSVNTRDSEIVFQLSIKWVK